MSAKPTLKTYTEAPRGIPTLRAEGRSLTLATLRQMVPGEELADPEHPGLRVRCVAGDPSNRLVFFYRYRNPAGALRQVEVGLLGPDLTLTSIRKRWEELRARVRNGGDPREEAKASRAEVAAKVEETKTAERVEALTVERVIERYLVEKVEHSRKTKGAMEARRMLTQLINFASWTAKQASTKTAGRRRKKLPEGVIDVAKLPAAKFTREIAHNLLLAYSASAPRAGGMARQELRAAWRYGIDAGFLEGPSPFEKVPGAKSDSLGGGAIKAASKKERALSTQEVGALLRWMREPGTFSRTAHDALALTLRTGLRSGEVCGIHTRELVRRDGVLWLDIPAERMKGGKPHSIPLVGTAEEIVLARTPADGGFLFPSREPTKPIQQKVLGVEVYACSGRSDAPAYKHRKVCPVASWAPHDLRRTARTLLAELGCPFEVGEAILAHTLPGVAAVYNRAVHEKAKVEWLTKLGVMLDDLARGQAKLKIARAA
ncbi:MAG: tyrosine-type recombinase/integrase [Hydrogenophaga sp.]